MKKKEDLVLCASFNSAKTVVAFGMQDGFRVYSLVKFTEMLRVDLEGGVGLIDMFEYSNLFALRTANSRVYEDKNRVTIYDGKGRKVIATLNFEIGPRSLRITNNYILVCFNIRSFLYRLSPNGIDECMDLWCKGNPEGACDLSVYKKTTYMVVPVGFTDYQEKGIVGVYNLDSQEEDPYLIRAFDKQVDLLRLDKDISRVVAYCHDYLMIRIFEIRTGKLLQSLKRDYQSPLTSMEFSTNNLFLVICDRHSDIEIYNTYGTDRIDREQLNVNRTSIFLFLSNLVPQFKNEWSFSSKRSVESCPGMSFFTSDSQFCVVSFNGQHMKYSFDILYGGDCFLEEKVCDFIL
jgi:WD40 repeat protein